MLLLIGLLCGVHTDCSFQPSVSYVQVKDSFQESHALQERFQEDIMSVREDAERRLAERSRNAKRQQVRLHAFLG